MLAQNHDHHHNQDGDHRPLRFQGPRRYSAIVPAESLDEHGCLIDELIRFALDTLGVQHLELRVYEAK
jgi:hypothetical protein